MLKKQVYVGILMVVIVAVAALLVFQSGLLDSPHHDNTGFTMVSLNDNSVLLYDSDVLQFNSTSQELLLTDTASQRLQSLGINLYNFSNVVSIRVNGEEIYRGIFRNAAMSAVPQPPTIAILYPSITFPEGTVKNCTIQLFYPSFTPPSDMQAMNTKLTNFFEDTYRVAIYSELLPGSA
jgi:hypothetical protein